MTLRLHHAPRTDLLADDLGDLLAVPLPDPFAEDVVVVPAKGVERWLAQRLSHRLGSSAGDDGVCAGVRFLTPGSLVSLLLDRDRDDPWHPDQLVWPLLDAIDASLSEPWCATLAAHLGHGDDTDLGSLRRDRRYAVAHRLARLFAAYTTQRPGLAAAWREGRLTDGADGVDEERDSLPEDLHWQARLWPRLEERVDAEPPDVRHARVVAALTAGGDGLDLPARLSLFGHTRLAATEVALLGALGTHRDVHLWLPQPSPALWRALADLGGPVPRADDPSVERVGHPLLGSLGRDTRELRRTIEPLLRAGSEAETGGGTDGVEAPATLLGRLQHDLRANHAPGPDERASRPFDPADRSLQVHACHGPARQVEVLREVLVGLLDDDPTLQPRDIVVMCPDIETYAPLVSAGFGLGTDDGGRGHPAHRLRVRLADRAPVSTNPLLGVAATLVELAGGRATAPEVLDLAALPAVRARFALTDDDLDRVARWVGEAGIRWGVDAEARARFAMGAFEHNTWRSGLDRVLLGVAMSGDDHRHVGRGFPVDDVGSNDVDLAGRLAELVDRLDACLEALDHAADVGGWTSALREGVLALTDVDDDSTAWQRPQLERELARVAASAGSHRVPLRLADVRALLASRLSGRPTRANFRTGTLTVCTMVPMRSVPHRVVCLLGLDDGTFPRASEVDGDDVLARRPLTGERDARSEDRQLLLDALLAATERVVVTYTGANEHSGAPRPPAVPLGEVLDAADRTLATPVRNHVLTHHPLQPHDARNLAPGALLKHDRRPFSFDPAALSGAAAALAERVPPPPLLTDALPAHPETEVSLDDLRSFFLHPVRAFCRQRLDVTVPLEPDDVGEAIPITLDALEQWGVGDRLLREVLAGADPVAVMTAEQLRGTLPPGRLGVEALHGVVEQAQSLIARTADLREGERRSIDVDVDLGGGRRLTGTVTGLHGHRLVSLGYSRLRAKQRLAAWVDLLALSAGRPDQSWTSHAVGRERAGPRRALAGPLDHRAVDWLRALVELRDLGLQRPLPVPIATGLAWAEGHHRELRGEDVSAAALAEREWHTDVHRDAFPHEDADPYHERAFGRSAPLQRLLDAGLEEHAWTVWQPLLDGAERVAAL